MALFLSLDSWRKGPVLLPTHPRLRASITGQIDPEDHNCVVLYDGARLSRQMLRLRKEAVAILQYFDGSRTLADVQVALLPATGGQLLPLNILEDIIGKLDEALFLHSDRFVARQQEFLRTPIREPICLGTYDANPTKLRRQLDAQFVRDQGPGQPQQRQHDPRLRGALIPHIDYGRGGHVYAWGFKEVLEKAEADVFVIIGTSHYSPHRFSLTRKDFRTPLGIVETDKEYVNRIATYYGPAVFTDELAHWPEHSIELHVVFLQHVLAGRPCKIVPLLVGSFQDTLETRTMPEKVADVQRMIQALQRSEKESGQRVFYLSSGDLAHVGPKFGDEQPVHEAQLNVSRRQDHALLQSMEKADRVGLYQILRAEMDERRICGYPPTYVVMAALEPTRGRLLSYDQYVEPNGYESVSFASLAFYKD